MKTRAEYKQGWREYLSSLRRVAPKYQVQFDMAAMFLRTHEDKTYRGANIASLSVPWGGGANANELNVGGYHLVWSRDLYQVATALYAMGDKAGADRALNYLFKVQQKPDGSFPQNSWLDGRPFWGSLQMDEVAYPRESGSITSSSNLTRRRFRAVAFSGQGCPRSQQSVTLICNSL